MRLYRLYFELAFPFVYQKITQGRSGSIFSYIFNKKKRKLQKAFTYKPVKYFIIIVIARDVQNVAHCPWTVLLLYRFIILPDFPYPLYPPLLQTLSPLAIPHKNNVWSWFEMTTMRGVMSDMCYQTVHERLLLVPPIPAVTSIPWRVGRLNYQSSWW